MGSYTATVYWERREAAFSDNAYSRAHVWEFDGGLSVLASASPEIVPLPLSVAENVDPEEAFVASLSSCHMLFFLSIARKRGFIVDRYVDNAVGELAEDDRGTMTITKVTLRPDCVYSGDPIPNRNDVETMHRQAHRLCFIANSVKSEVITEIVG